MSKAEVITPIDVAVPDGRGILRNRSLRRAGGRAAILLFVSTMTMGADSQCREGGYTQRQEQRRVDDLSNNTDDKLEKAKEADKKMRQENGWELPSDKRP